MDRRAYLGLVGVAAASLAGCLTREEPDIPETPTDDEPTPERTPEPTPEQTPEYPEGVNVVEDLGCDPTGREPCAARIRQALEDDIVLRFPSGTYRFEHRLRISQFSSVVMLGEGPVQLLPPEGYNNFLIDVSEVGNFVFSGIDIDITAPETTAGVRILTRDSFLVDDVEYIGRGNHPNQDVVHAMLLGLTTAEGRGVIRNFRAKKGSAIGHYKNGDGRGGISIGPWNSGDIRIENCHLEEFGNNGIYASRTTGNIEVIGGTFRNNNVAGIRIAGEGSYVEGATVEVDLDSYTGPLTQLDSQFNTRGIVIEQGPTQKPAGAEIRNCTIVIEKTPQSKGGIYVFPTGRTVTVRDSTIRINADNVPGVFRSPLERQGQYRPPDGPSWVRLENVLITGTARGASGIILADAPESVIRNCTIDQSGEQRDGVYLSNSNSTVVDGGSVTTTRYPYIIEFDGDSNTDPCLLQFDAVPEIRQSSARFDPGQSDSTVLIDGREYRANGGGVFSTSGCMTTDNLSSPTGDNTLAITGTQNGQLKWLRFVPE
ncbi:hypothetical protein ACFQJC_17745 [Haloferax namakaokahaiae]|uniref:Right handed beta helix domain-containing protein n=1 Tax=Haloferax namakaokahaiae TaxID=1748331 RepID=A0ABD5ZJQ0_9EURY